jgi:hypothetical protein
MPAEARIVQVHWAEGRALHRGVLAVARQLQVGDTVRLLSIPDWLVHDLPADERQEIAARVGRTTQISEIDGHGYFWVGFGKTEDVGAQGFFSGHSLCVRRIAWS